MVMLAAIAALHADGPVTLDSADSLRKSWPDFLQTYASLGGQIE